MVDDDPENLSPPASLTPEALAEAVRQRRADLHLSQEDVREASGLSVTTISKIEHADDPDVRVHRATLRRLDVALRWPVGSCESLYEGRGGVPAATEAPLAALVEQLAPMVAAQLSLDRPGSIAVADLPPKLVEAIERLVIEIRDTLRVR